MILQAENSVPGLKTYSWPLDQIFWMRDPAAEQDRRFTEMLFKSLDKGMRYPILVAENEVWKDFFFREARSHHLYPKPIDVDKKYRVILGHNRCYYAHQKGFSSIEGCLTDNLDRDKLHYLRETSMEYGKDY